MRQHASLAAAVLLVVAAARAGAENPPAFDALHVGVDAEGFITLAGLTGGPEKPYDAFRPLVS